MTNPPIGAPTCTLVVYYYNCMICFTTCTIVTINIIERLLLLTTKQQKLTDQLIMYITMIVNTNCNLIAIYSVKLLTK